MSSARPSPPLDMACYYIAIWRYKDRGMGYIDVIDGAVRLAFCIAGRSLENAMGLVDGISPSSSENARDTFNRVRNFRRTFCDGPDPEPPPPPFTGGQCPGVWYDIAFVNNRTGQTVRPAALPGPILSYSTYQGPNFWTLQVVYGAGSVFEFRYDSVVYGTVTISGFTATRQDGQPDNCGDPFGELPDPVPPPPVTVNVDIGPSLNVPVTFLFAPVDFDIDGRLYAPVNVDIDIDAGVNLKGKLVLAPEVNFELDPDQFNPDPRLPDDPGDPAPPVPVPPTGGEGGPGSEGEELTGLLIVIKATPDGSSVYVPDIYRGVCWVYMGTSDGLALVPGGSFMRTVQMVYAPRPGLTNWSVIPNLGYDLEVVPYYRKVK